MKRLTNVLVDDKVCPQLQSVLFSIVTACKDISFRVGQGALSGVLGATQDENVQGEQQKKLDVIANQILKDYLAADNNVRSIASEEEDTIVAANETGDYIVGFDPLDGSSNIDINGQIGTIFTIFSAVNQLNADDPAQFQQTGREQVAAGYVLYGSSSVLVLTTGKGTQCFTLDKTFGEFVLTNDAMQVPTETQEFSINMANSRFWFEPIQYYINDLLKGEIGIRKKRYNMRWNAAMVGDVHRVLTRGGIFLYPQDKRDPNKPAKLRLLYEANPMAMLMENAGGKASTGLQPILDVKIDDLHQRVPVIMGSSEEVEQCQFYYNQ
ncbi:class 1 fructose-bisphosphatase [Catenovulum adriaticum]|uniref:Fructose-1,6-bisphosphatase class 1 n=1 Tax=Catenovulum adriaticum TaxID=2984846 RepID=A0ABY7ARN5_9ALTE|nr:class 1 fructose-bisphosphatase [Catenovulum sp. TS8]WAJ72144.1 class 1 fructose-bisphosphatase [Catenovulum sp. TS8]